jgi:CRP/FNR family cyclic AMP-dependent transcriptional regulator
VNLVNSRGWTSSSRRICTSNQRRARKISRRVGQGRKTCDNNFVRWGVAISMPEDAYLNNKDSWTPRSLLASVPETDRLALLRLGRPRRYERGDTLARSGEPGGSAFLIIDGCVKITGESAEGHPALLAIRISGDIVGELSVLDGEPRSASIQAATPLRTRIISAAELRQFLATRPATAAALQNSVAGKLREAIRDRIELNGAPVILRLARVIWKLGRTCGTETRDGVLISAFSQADLGALAGTTEQSIRRALATLRSEGMVRSEYRKLLITDMRRLREMATGK